MIMDGLSAFLYTNNVLFASGSVGSDSQIGFTLATSANVSHHARIDFAEVIAYSTTNTVANRTKIHDYLNTKYAVH